MSAAVLSLPRPARDARRDFAPPDDVPLLVRRAQNGEEGATEELLARFRPLLRSRAHRLWGALQDAMPGPEWGDVEGQIQLFFLTRLQAFRPEVGVYFPHYIEQMLDLDCRAWLRSQRRLTATPFSQLPPDDFDWEEGLEDGTAPDEAAQVEKSLWLREALATLPPTQHLVVWECCVKGRTEESVALQLGISRSAVRNRLSAALERLRAALREPDAAPLEVAPTRTGRLRRGETVAQQRRCFWDFWLEKMAMAKDEKRPDLVGVGAGRPVLLQGTFEFPATGLRSPQLLSPKLRYEVPPGSVLGVRYVRIGSICSSMAVYSTVVNGLTHRLIPVAADSTDHVAFAIVDPLLAGSQIEIHVASEAPGTAVIDVGCLQMPA